MRVLFIPEKQFNRKYEQRFQEVLDPILEMLDAWPDGDKKDPIEKHVCYMRKLLIKSLRYVSEAQEFFDLENKNIDLINYYAAAGDGLITAAINVSVLVFEEMNADCGRGHKQLETLIAV